ncbi:hypothetical protein [Pelagicoccus albus]|uniref:Tetratricopeptide repeat-containing protein n=1 Tax=Pelagicoccus albus TaxID=415222 RepID=A0A7X1B5W5_9BACT|nr:hypothetical protein [Pelagicoccus albus]MBC2604980.1 hypothetical protein [Pelagicoccus albus]
MKTYPALLRILPALLLLATFQLKAQDEERPIWEQEAMLIYHGQSTEFNRLRSLGKNNNRLALYTEALDTVYGKLKVEEEEPYKVAERIFENLISDNSSDAIGLASAYYLARVVQSNPYEKDIAKAKMLYWDLYEKWPERFFGQMAFVKYATLHIYDDDGSGDEVLTRIQDLEPMLNKISISKLKQNAHRIMGEAYVAFELDSESAFKHLKKAYDLGVPVQSIKIEVLERLAVLGEEIGETERALSAYDELLLIAPNHPQAIAFAENASRLRQQLNESALSQ